MASTDHPTEGPTDDEWHYMDCGIAGGFPHRASDHVTPSPTPEASRFQITTYGGGQIVQHWQLRFDGSFVADTSDPSNAARWEEMVGIESALTEEREAHQRTREQRDELTAASRRMLTAAAEASRMWSKYTADQLWTAGNVLSSTLARLEADDG